LNVVLNIIKKLRSIDDAIKVLRGQIDFSDDIQELWEFCPFKAHEGAERRKKWVKIMLFHPILVASITDPLVATR